jgi:glycerophosphoryl diester phosphodiesterase
MDACSILVPGRSSDIAAIAPPPENTLESLRQAVALGVDAVEFDLRVSRDGALVMIHDETLDRTTNGSGPVALRT